MTSLDDFPATVRRLLATIAPNKSQELDQLLEGVTFVADDQSEGIAHAAVSNWKLVRFARRCQSRLWAHCYAYYCTFAVFTCKRCGESPGSRYGLSDADIKLAGDFLEWAKTVDVTVRQAGTGLISVDPVPSGAPLPFEGETSSTVKRMAEEIFLRAVGFILLHELAHVQMGHQGAEGEMSLQQEFEADKSAARFLLSDPGLTEEEYLIRHLGVAIALLWFTTLDFYEKSQGRTHPPSWERLYQALEPTVRNEIDPIWGFVVLALMLHFHRNSMSLESLQEIGPTKYTVGKMLDMVANHNLRLK